MKNNIGDSIYLFKNYLCFSVIKPLVTDSTGKIIKENMGLMDCVGERKCPYSTDLILIKPGETVKYPLTKIGFYNFKALPNGLYSIRIKYEFKKPVEINTLYYRDIKTLIIGLRGSYISSNELEFMNKENN